MREPPRQVNGLFKGIRQLDFAKAPLWQICKLFSQGQKIGMDPLLECLGGTFGRSVVGHNVYTHLIQRIGILIFSSHHRLLAEICAALATQAISKKTPDLKSHTREACARSARDACCTTPSGWHCPLGLRTERVWLIAFWAKKCNTS